MDKATNVTPEAKAAFDEGLRLSHDPATVNHAAAAFERAIQLHPNYRLAYLYLGGMYFTWSHFQKAIEPLKKAIELDPQEPGAYYVLGKNYNLANMYTAAEDVLRKFINLVPDNAEAYYELGYAALQQFSKDTDAIQYFKEAVRLQPQHSRAYDFLGSALVRNRDFVGAKELAVQLRELYPKQAEHLANLISLNDPKAK
jgi:tetratricopeptide (TPR) repeat protein